MQTHRRSSFFLWEKIIEASFQGKKITTNPWCNILTCTILHHPMCNCKHYNILKQDSKMMYCATQGKMQKGIPFVVAYQNVTPEQ